MSEPSGGWEPPAGANPGGAWQSSWTPPRPEPQPAPQPGDASQLRFEQVPADETSGKATAALVLGILGIVVIPFVCSILALVFGYMGRKEIDASGGRLGGRGNAQAGIVLGWIGLVIYLLLAIALIALVAGGAFDSLDEFEEFGEPITAALAALPR